jgi:hypothetical protein
LKVVAGLTGLVGLIAVLALGGCSASQPVLPQSHSGGVPCASDPTCTPYSGDQARAHGQPVAWIAQHPLSAQYYFGASGSQFVVEGPCNSITLPLQQHGSRLVVDTSNIRQTAEGCADGSTVASREAIVHAVLLSRQVVGRINTTSDTITFSAGTDSITFVTA